MLFTRLPNASGGETRNQPQNQMKNGTESQAFSTENFNSIAIASFFPSVYSVVVCVGCRYTSLDDLQHVTIIRGGFALLSL